jgi:hypothetical protein
MTDGGRRRGANTISRDHTRHHTHPRPAEPHRAGDCRRRQGETQEPTNTACLWLRHEAHEWAATEPKHQAPKKKSATHAGPGLRADRLLLILMLCSETIDQISIGGWQTSEGVAGSEWERETESE